MRVRVPGLATCMATLALMHALPHVVGLRRTFSLVRRLAPLRPASGWSDDLVAGTVRRVAMAGAFYPTRALCLEQSLVLYVLLRRRGVPADLRLGAQPRPFRAHAWVEVDGRPIAESASLPLILAPFPNVGV